MRDSVIFVSVVSLFFGMRVERPERRASEKWVGRPASLKRSVTRVLREVRLWNMLDVVEGAVWEAEVDEGVVVDIIVMRVSWRTVCLGLLTLVSI
jgi:hypothetical protein